eukprot:4524055-Prymnesium_polylepis.1
MRPRARLALTLAPDSCDTRHAARAMYGSRGSLLACVCGPQHVAPVCSLSGVAPCALAQPQVTTDTPLHSPRCREKQLIHQKS